MLFFSSCAHKKIKNDLPPAEVFSQVCSIGDAVEKAQGSVALELHSVEISGRYPAEVVIEGGMVRNLTMEVLNLFGGVEALVKVQKAQSYEVSFPHRDQKKQVGQGSWTGIPLGWAIDLFLGKIPCPKGSSPKHVFIEDSHLKVEILSNSQVWEHFDYDLIDEAGKIWPRALVWERGSQGQVRVEFEFSKPEENTQSPLHWKAKSKKGSLEVSWRERVLTPKF